MCFVEQPMVSLSYYNGVIQGAVLEELALSNHLTIKPIWKCRPGIGDQRFKFPMDILQNYTFYTWIFYKPGNDRFMKFDASLRLVSLNTCVKRTT